MWHEESAFYQIYPIGFCGAPETQDGMEANRIEKLREWIPHFRELGVGALYLCPVFESDSHGYDTRDYRRIDPRLGSNAAFAEVCAALKQAGIRLVLDGVFNHVGRGFWAFQDVLKNREASRYRDWFHIRFDGNNGYNDGLWYEGWEGHENLVKLNLHNEEVMRHLYDCVMGWVNEFGIDGLRLDVAYMLPEHFLRGLRQLAERIAPDFFLIGETIHGDYNRIVNPEMLHSCTNYECYKGIYSSLNDRNLFEIAYSLNRQFGSEEWTLYKGKRLLNFVDNHDVARLASALKEEKHLPLAYALLFGMPGIPCIYYGSEWGAKGEKVHGTDVGLRPCFDAPEKNTLSENIAKLSRVWRAHPALRLGAYRQLYLTNTQFIFERAYEGQRVWVAINAWETSHVARFDTPECKLRALLSGGEWECRDGLELAPYSMEMYLVG